MDWLSKILNVPKLIIRIWIILWISLFILIAMKFCFNIWYPIVIENEIVLAICNFIDNHWFPKCGMMLLFYFLNINIWFLTTIKKTKYENKFLFILMNLIYLIGYVLKYFSNLVGVLFELIYLVFIPIFINLKKDNFIIVIRKIEFRKLANILVPIIIYFILNLYQLSIAFVRGIDEYLLTNIPTVIAYTLQIDYYIFLIITWIGVNYFMGLFGGGWIWSKSITELKAMKQEELAKDKPDAKLLKQLDDAIAKKEKQENEA